MGFEELAHPSQPIRIQKNITPVPHLRPEAAQAMRLAEHDPGDHSKQMAVTRP
jgi:hypothetical protein